jgi:hypothetical protein
MEEQSKPNSANTNELSESPGLPVSLNKVCAYTELGQRYQLSSSKQTSELIRRGDLNSMYYCSPWDSKLLRCYLQIRHVCVCMGGDLSQYRRARAAGQFSFTCSAARFSVRVSPCPSVLEEGSTFLSYVCRGLFVIRLPGSLSYCHTSAGVSFFYTHAPV